MQRPYLSSAYALIFGFVFGGSAILGADDNAGLQLSGRDGESQTLTAAEFRELPRTEIEVKERDGATVRYSGVELSHLLSRLGVPQGENLRGPWLRAFAIVGASDDYEAVFCAAGMRRCLYRSQDSSGRHA